MDDIKNIIAKNLVRLRKEKRLTQLELAEKLNYSDKSVSRWEKGEITPDVETLVKLCEIYNIEISKIFEAELNLEVMQKEVKADNRNKLFISLLAVSCVWFLVISLYIIIMISSGENAWKLFIFGCPLMFLVAIVFNALWGKRIINFILISLFVWSFIISLFIQFFDYQSGPLFIIGVPIQVIIILWSQLKKTK